MNAAKNMDTVFAQCTADDLDFDVFFDQEDSLIDTVNGVNESGDPLTGSDDFELIHQTEEDVDVDDIRDELGPDNKTDEEIKGAEGTDEVDLEKDQTIDNLESNKEVKVDKEDVTDMSDKEIKDGAALESVDPAKLLRSLHKAGYTIVKEESECPECKEEHKDVDDEIDPVSAPSADPSEKEAPVSGEVPSDTGSTEDGVKEDKPSEDFSPEGDDEHNSTSAVDECGDVDPEALKAALDKLGYKIVKKDDESEAEAPAEEGTEEEKTEESSEEVEVSEEPVEDAKDEACGQVKEDFSDMNIMEESCITFVNEKAKFSFFPKFKEDPALKDLWDEAKEADMYLAQDGVDSKTSALKILKLVLRICNIFRNMCSVITTPAAFLVVGLIPHLLIRAIDYLERFAQDKIAEEYTKKIIASLEASKKEAKDPKVKDEIQKKIDKINARLEKFNEAVDLKLESVDVTKLLESLHKAGYTIVKEEDEEAIDVTGTEEESNEDTVEEEPIVADDDEAALESVDVTKLLESLHKAGYTIVKEEDEVDTEEVEDDIAEDDDESTEDFSDMNIMEESCITFVNEKAKFSFFPRFKQDPALKDLWDEAKEADMYLAQDGVDSKATALKILKLVLRIINVYNDIITTLTLPAAFLVIGLIPHLLARAVTYLYNIAEEKTAEEYTKKIVVALAKAKKDAKDPKVKDEIQKKIDKINDKLEKLSESATLESVDVTKLLESLHKAGYTIVKEEDEVDAQIDVKEELEDEIDDDTVEESEDTDSSSIDLSYDISDEDLINAALGK